MVTRHTTTTERIPFKPQWMARVPSPSFGYRVYITHEVKRYIENIWPVRRFKLEKVLEQLRALPRPFTALYKKNQVGNLSLNIQDAGFVIQYLINSGEITIVAIRADATDPRNEKMGLYLIDLKTRAGQKAFTTITRTRTTSVKTEFAAINGQSNNLNDAANLMRKHLTCTLSKNIKTFTLFHNPTQGGIDDTFESAIDRNGGPTKVAAHVSQILRNTHEIHNKVKWLVHSQGGLIFKSAVAHHNRGHGTRLDTQSVQFNAGANNIAETDHLLQKAGITVLGYNNNPNDFVPMVVGKNTNNPVRIIACFIALPLVLWSGPKWSPHTLPYAGTGLYRDWRFWNFKREQR